MTNLGFAVTGIDVEPYAAAPLLLARLRVDESTGSSIHAIALRCQVRIEPQRRGYQPDETDGLWDQFGGRDRWPATMKPFLWMQCSAMVQGFTTSTEVDLQLPVTYDFDVTASKYLHALRDGVVPLSLLFSGTVFTRGDSGFAVEQVPWDREARYDMPVAVWRALLDRYFPNAGWLRLDRDTIEALAAFKASSTFLTWDETVSALLTKAGVTAP